MTAKKRDSFSAVEASRIADVPYGSLDYWARTKLVIPSIAEANGTGTERRYDFKDLLALRAVKELRQRGISTQALRQAVEYVREVRHPLSECRFLAIGKTIIWVKAEDEIVSVARNPGQGTFAFMVFDYPSMVQEINAAVEAHRRAA
jgi:DNA-binding transcriptional MerR regulator